MDFNFTAFLIRPCCLLLFFCMGKKAPSQSYFYNDRYYDAAVLVELGLGAGIINCLTDLGGKDSNRRKFLHDINWRNSRPGWGIEAAVTWNDFLGLRVELNGGMITASDSLLHKYQPDAGSQGRWKRNLHFKSRINEYLVVAEFYPLALLQCRAFPSRLAPYFFAGIGRFSYNPQAFYRGKWIDLAPLHLEGQGFPEYPERSIYQLRAWSYPLGFGVKYDINRLLALRWQLNYRFTSTDYLDDVSAQSYADPDLFRRYLNSTEAALANSLYNRRSEINPGPGPPGSDRRGNAQKKDGYFTVELKLGLILGRTPVA